ncbi:hypothetical protein B0G84_5712 [Paraburkholderia sp. BL8N3]|nr:hypothetical protein [Paraburkholderia sp. BL8N3]TCK36699.1 hypothetical protein B0G84_5712 [Paraburkholderia sp. BL8N3]
MKHIGEHSNWTIETTPTQVGQLWRANAIATRHPTEAPSDDHGSRYEFHDLGECATREVAERRAVQWVTHWIEINF